MVLILNILEKIYPMLYDKSALYLVYIDGLVLDFSNSSVLAMKLLQSCTKPLI